MSTKVGKRPARQATTAEKLNAIKRVQNGESKASVARNINVPESTLRGWCKNEDRILQDYNKSLGLDDEIPDEVPSEPDPKKPKLDDNSNSIQQPFNLTMELAQTDSLTTADNKDQEKICPQNLSTVTLNNGRSTLGKEKRKPVGLSLLDQRSKILLSHQISDCHKNNRNQRSALEINGHSQHSPVSSSAQPSSLLCSAKSSIKQNPVKPSKENMHLSNGWNKFLEHQQANIYDARNMNHGKSSFDGIYTASGSNGTSLSPTTTRKLSNEEAALLRQLILMNFHQEMLYQKLSSSANSNSEPLLYQQLTKPEQLSVAIPVEQPLELTQEQVYAEDLSLHSRGDINSDTSGSPRQCFMSHGSSPANSQTSLSNSSSPSPTRMFPGTATCVPIDMSTPVSSFADCSMRYRENGNHYRETNHNNVSKKVASTSSQSSSNGQKSFRKILKPKFEINNLLPENERNKYLNGKFNRQDSGITSEDDEDLGSILAAGEKFLKWLERGKEKSVTHIQVNQVREIVKRLRTKV